MAFKCIILTAFVAVANAGAIGYGLPAYTGAPAVTYAASPLHHSHVPAVAYSHAPAVGIAKVAAPVAYAAPIAKTVVAEEYDANPQYSYAYDIQDAVTGDSKNQHENRNGDVVSGSYSVVDPDGFKRTVEYTADPHNGFNAVVHREPLGVAVKAPVTKYAAAPVPYAASVAKYYH